MKLSGLGFINASHSPHYDFEPHRKQGLKEMMKKTSGIAIAIDNCCAIEVVDDKYRIIYSKKGAMAYKVYWKKGKFYEEIIKQEKDFKPLTELTNS